MEATTSPLLLPGYLGFILVFGMLLYRGIAYWRTAKQTRKKDNREFRHEDRSDAATLIGSLQTALNSERAENGKLHERCDDLQNQLDAMRHKRDEDQAEIQKLREQVLKLLERLDKFQEQYTKEET